MIFYLFFGSRSLRSCRGGRSLPACIDKAQEYINLRFAVGVSVNSWCRQWLLNGSIDSLASPRITHSSNCLFTFTIKKLAIHGFSCGFIYHSLGRLYLYPQLINHQNHWMWVAVDTLISPDGTWSCCPNQIFDFLQNIPQQPQPYPLQCGLRIMTRKRRLRGLVRFQLRHQLMIRS